MTSLACSDVREHLSAYYDGELPLDLQRAVARHLDACHQCAEILDGYRRLSALAGSLDETSVPPGDWQPVEEALEAEQAVPAAAERTSPGSAASWRRTGLIAAVLFVALSIVWLAFRPTDRGPGDPHLAAVLADYLEQFQADPDRAVRHLVAKYEGKAVDADAAVRYLGYRPVVAERLPDGYTVEGMYVLRMPCCACVQTLCRDRKGNAIAFFEHDDRQSEWFQGRPMIRCQCAGKQCCMGQLDSRLAASWKVGPRYVTVVGAQDVDQVRDLVARLKGTGHSG